MGTSQRQIEANRRNAQRSTGPRTPQGKARSARNALKHGLFSRQVVVSLEDAEAFAAFRAGMLEDLRPEGALESLLADRAICEAWRLARVVAIERDQMEDRIQDCRDDHELFPQAYAGPPTLGEAVARQFEGPESERLRRHEVRTERSMYRALGELRGLQASRRAGELSWAARLARGASRSPGRRAARGPAREAAPVPADALAAWEQAVREDLRQDLLIQPSARGATRSSAAGTTTAPRGTQIRNPKPECRNKPEARNREREDRRTGRP